MKKILIFLLMVFTLAACQQWDFNNNSEKKETDGTNRQTVGLNLSIHTFQQQVLSGSGKSQIRRSNQDFTVDQIMTGELTVTNKQTNQTEKHNWTVFLNESDFSVQSNKTIILGIAEHDFQLTLTKGNQQYIGQTIGFTTTDGTNDVPMTIKPVIGDTITNLNLLEKINMVRFQYDKTQLATFTTPKLGIIVDKGTETIYAIDPATGLTNNYANLSEGSHQVVLKLYDGDKQVAKSNPAQESVTVTLGNNITMDLIPLAGETNLTLTENGGDAKFRINLPSELITEAGSAENLEAQLTIVGPKNPIKETTIPVSSAIDTTGDTYHYAETTLSGLHYDTVNYTVTFLDKTTPLKDKLGKCALENVLLNKIGSATPCPITITRPVITIGNLYSSLDIKVFDDERVPIPGVKIKVDGQLVGITGAGSFGNYGYLKHQTVKGNHKILVEDIQSVETDITVDSLDVRSIDITLNQNINWKLIDGGGDYGINHSSTNNAASGARFANLNNKLYAAWSEYNGFSHQIRVAVYNNNSDSPAWSFIDSDTTNGINKDPVRPASWPYLTVFNNKLYAIWSENKTGDHDGQIRVAVYNGNDDAPSWQFVDGNGTNGINKDPATKAKWPQLEVANGKLYAIWTELVGANYEPRIAVYSGNDSAVNWSFIEANIPDGASGWSINYFPRLTVFNNKIVAAWNEHNNGQYRMRIALYNGNDTSPSWKFIEGSGATGIVDNSEEENLQIHLTTYNGKLYATWRKYSSSPRAKVAVYNGNDASPAWQLIHAGVNDPLEENGRRPMLAVFNDRLHIIWRKIDGSQTWIRVAAYNGDDSSPYWRTVNGTGKVGININPDQSSEWFQLVTFNNKLYATWVENNGSEEQIRIAEGTY